MLQQTLSALSDPVRREILKMLKKGDRSAGQIAERFDISLPAISRHLAVLRESELVTSHREGKNVYYRINTENIRDLADWLYNFLRENE